MQVTRLNKIRNLESFVYTAVMVDLEELCCFSHAVVCAVFFVVKQELVGMWCVIHFGIFIYSNFRNGAKCWSSWMTGDCLCVATPHIHMVAIIFTPLPLPPARVISCQYIGENIVNM